MHKTLVGWTIVRKTEKYNQRSYKKIVWVSSKIQFLPYLIEAMLRKQMNILLFRQDVALERRSARLQLCIEGLKSKAADELLITVRSLVVCFCAYCSRRAAGDQTSHSARCYTLRPRFSEKGSQGSLRGSAEAADLLPEHSAGSTELQRAALWMC